MLLLFWIGRFPYGPGLLHAVHLIKAVAAIASCDPFRKTGGEGTPAVQPGADARKVEGIEDVELQRRRVRHRSAKIESDPLALHGLEKGERIILADEHDRSTDVHRRREPIVEW